MKKRISNVDKSIFKSLYKARRPLTIRAISKRTGYSWTTSRDHINKLQKLGVVNNKRTIRRNNVMLNPKYWKLKR